MCHTYDEYLILLAKSGMTKTMQTTINETLNHKFKYFKDNIEAKAP
jgi:hypothetical protein